jgi:hypothetical protein
MTPSADKPLPPLQISRRCEIRLAAGYEPSRKRCSDFESQSYAAHKSPRRPRTRSVDIGIRPDEILSATVYRSALS